MKQEISREQYDRLSNNILLDYVRNATPIVWHQMAMDWDYDNDNVFYDFFIDNPEIDRATALMSIGCLHPDLVNNIKTETMF